MSDSDLLLVIDGPDDLSVFLPSKLIEYIGAGTPIYGIVPPGTSATVLRRLGGLVADPRDNDQVADALVRALQLARERKVDVNRTPWGDADIRAKFTIDRVTRDFAAILTDVIARKVWPAGPAAS
jgi:glycosyltransferase involved in cell wall biosynthesis